MFVRTTFYSFFSKCQLFVYFQVKKTFHENSWWDHHERWKDMRYRWLPTWKEIPKHLHESALLSHLEELEVNTYYKYAFFQIFNTIGRYSSFSISLKKKSGTLSMHKFFFSVLWRNIFSTFLLF